MEPTSDGIEIGSSFIVTPWVILPSGVFMGATVCCCVEIGVGVIRVEDLSGVVRCVDLCLGMDSNVVQVMRHRTRGKTYNPRILSNLKSRAQEERIIALLNCISLRTFYIRRRTLKSRAR